MKLSRRDKRNIQLLRIGRATPPEPDRVTPLEVYLLTTADAVRRRRRRDAIGRGIERLTTWPAMLGWLALAALALAWLSRLAPTVGATL